MNIVYLTQTGQRVHYYTVDSKVVGETMIFNRFDFRDDLIRFSPILYSRYEQDL